MTSPGGNGRFGYRVVYPPAVRQEARRLIDGLGADDQRRAAKALRVIHARLRTDPLEFGEPRFAQAGVPHTVRAGGVVPLIVRFAVYESQRTVWVLGFHLPGR
jgi:hypothetical protein